MTLPHENTRDDPVRSAALLISRWSGDSPYVGQLPWMPCEALARQIIAELQACERTLRLAQALRIIRDTCPGVASNIAGRALREAEIEDPEDDDFPAMTAEEAASLEEMESRGV